MTNTNLPSQPLEKPLRSKRSHRRPAPSPPPTLLHHNAPPTGYPTSSFPELPPTNGTLTMRLSTHPNSGPISFAPNYNNANEILSSNHHISSMQSGPQQPPSPFDDFLERRYYSERQYGDQTMDEQLIARAHRDWANMGEAETEVYRARHERRYQAYQAAMDESRERDVEGNRGSRGGGGFTAVNG